MANSSIPHNADLDMKTNQIKGLGDPTLAQDGATKNYVDTTVFTFTNLPDEDQLSIVSSFRFLTGN